MSSSANRSQRPSAADRRKSSTLHYHTFPTKPPTSKGRPPSASPRLQQNSEGHSSPHSSDGSRHHEESPLPVGQLVVLAIIALAEQTALNSIAPYLPRMASTFPEVHQNQVGLYVGLIASSFALAQFATNFFWGYLSDRIGRKPVVLAGTILTAACFLAFGFCRTLWQAMLVQLLMGLVNGNQTVISTCLGEITDRSNQSRAFTYLPVVYGIGGITGPLVGGLLVFQENPFDKGKPNPYPYLAPNLLSAAVLLVDLVIASIWLEESLEEARSMPPLGKRVRSLFTWLWQFSGLSHNPTYTRRHPIKRRGTAGSRDQTNGSYNGSIEDDDSHAPDALFPDTAGDVLPKSKIFNRDTILLLITYFIFQLANVSYMSLYPIFGESAPPTGRDLNEEEIGISLAFAALVTIVFQVGVYGRLKKKSGNKATYRISLGVFVAVFFLTPFIGYKDGGKAWLWTELGAVLAIRTIASVGGFTSVLLLITNSAPTHAVLGTLNGLAQTLSAAGRAIGPFLSGSLFSAGTRLHPKGEALPFGVFGGIAFIGFLLSFGIRSPDLESDDWSDEDGEGDEDGDDTAGDAEEQAGGEDEERPLLRR